MKRWWLRWEFDGAVPVGQGRPVREAVIIRFKPLLIVLLVNLVAIAAVAIWQVVPEVRRTPLPALTMKDAPLVKSSAGPWGTLERRRIVVSAPGEFLGRWRRVEPTMWVFPDHTESMVFNLLRRCGFSSREVEMAQAQRWSRSPAGVVIEVADELVWSLSAEARSKLYNFLAEFPVNERYQYSTMLERATWEELLRSDWLKPGTTELFRRLLYPRGTKLILTDAPVLLRRIDSEDERKRASEVLSAGESILLRLVVRPDSDVNALVDYWGRGGRAKDLRPLIESLARVPGGTDVDVVHLLPPFARRRMYTFPFPSFDRRYSSEDCHWTSLNFFREVPDDRFSDPVFCEQVIRRDYEPVVGAPRFGDIVAIISPTQQMVHSAIYIADGVVFTKNGGLLNTPWMLMELPTMLDGYRATYAGGANFEARYYRPKAL